MWSINKKHISSDHTKCFGKNKNQVNGVENGCGGRSGQVSLRRRRLTCMMRWAGYAGTLGKRLTGMGEQQVQRPWGGNELDVLKTWVEREEECSRRWVKRWEEWDWVHRGEGATGECRRMPWPYLHGVTINVLGQKWLTAPTSIPPSVLLQSPGQKTQL